MRRTILLSLSRITAAVALLLVAAVVLIRQPVLTSLPSPGTARADAATLRRHVEALAAHRTSDYMANALRAEGATVVERNPNYHTRNDTPATLDYARMALVVDGVFSAAVHLAGGA